MSALTGAREALATAQETLQAAQVAERAARAEAEGLRNRIADGDPKVAPADLTAADAKAEHARIAAIGAERGIDELASAVRSAETDATCDAILDRLPVLGSAVQDSLEVVLDALQPLVAAATAYDDFIDQSTQAVSRHTQDLSARVTVSRMGPPTIDHRRLESCRGPSQLAAAILPAMRALGAPASVTEGLKQMAAGAPALPTV